MKKEKIIITALTCVVVALFVALCINMTPIVLDDELVYYNFRGGCVPNERSAVKIAQVVYRTRTKTYFGEDEFCVKYDDEVDAWNVYLRDYMGEDDYLDYRGVFIDKNYGTVLRDYIDDSEVEKYYENKAAYEKTIENVESEAAEFTMIKNEEMAVRIGKIILEERYPEVYYSIAKDIVAEKRNNVWHVYNDFEPVQKLPDGTMIATMGGGYYVDIDGNTGEVVKIGVND